MDELIDNLQSIIGAENVLSQPDELLVYECDGLPHHKYLPRAVVFPSSTEETSSVMRVLAKHDAPFTPRGAGTGLSGGALALNQGVVIEMARMRKILRIDPENRLAVVQPGVVNLHVSNAAAAFGLYYVPDPSSQPTCTIGGNIAEGAGGIHCLKYGTTTDHVLALKVVLSTGEIVELGDATGGAEGYDLVGTFIGSEGTFGIATEATLRLSQTPPAVRTLLAEFEEVNDASHAVSEIIAAGVMPAALEMMDGEIIRAVEASVFAAGLPPDAGAALLIELDGIASGIDDEAARVTTICMEYGARNCRLARDENERKKLWAARKGAFGAIGRISPDSMIQDAVVPRSRLPEVLDAAYGIASKYELRIANVFHAGDGNLHPLICFDSRFPDQVDRVKEAGRELMQVCVNAGGTITGEHGVGLDKRELLPTIFSETDMDAMLRVRAAFDPTGVCNPGKVIPVLRGCGEARAIAIGANMTTETVSSNGEHQKPSPPLIVPKQSFDISKAVSRLQTIVGDGECVVGADSNVVVAPGSTEELAEVLKLTTSEGWMALPVGSSTWARHLQPAHTGVVIRTTRLNRILEHEPKDLICVAEAGVRLSNLNAKLGDHGQWLPLDPPDNGEATIGGVVATGLAGAQQIGYGRPRGYVIGMQVALADGNLIKVGGRVVKNVAGYDLCKLFTGSYGTLGVITEINFKLRPRPEEEATILVTGKLESILSAGEIPIKARLFPVAVELVSASLARHHGIADDCALLVRFAGNKKAVSFQSKETLTWLRNHATSRVDLINEDDELWRKIARAPLVQGIDAEWSARMLPSELLAFLKTLNNLFRDEIIWHAGIGDGRVRGLHRSVPDLEQLQGLEAAAKKASGRLVIERGLAGEAKPSSKQQLSKRIKEQLDPNRTFPSMQFG